MIKTKVAFWRAVFSS